MSWKLPTSRISTTARNIPIPRRSSPPCRYPIRTRRRTSGASCWKATCLHRCRRLRAACSEPAVRWLKPSAQGKNRHWPTLDRDTRWPVFSGIRSFRSSEGQVGQPAVLSAHPESQGNEVTACQLIRGFIRNLRQLDHCNPGNPGNPGDSAATCGRLPLMPGEKSCLEFTNPRTKSFKEEVGAGQETAFAILQFHPPGPTHRRVDDLFGITAPSIAPDIDRYCGNLFTAMQPDIL